MNFIQNIFSIKNDDTYHKIIRILGIKIKIKNVNKYVLYQLSNLINDRTAQVISNEQILAQDSVRVVSQDATNSIRAVAQEINGFTQHTLLNKNILYNNDFEKQYVEQFYVVYESADFQEKFLKLVNGLDEDSAKTIATIINRQLAIRNTLGQPNDIYNLEEKNKIRELNENFWPLIIKLSEEMYALGKYLLPINHFEPSVFYDKHGLDYVKDLESIKNKDIIDAGGFIGDSILILSPLTNKAVYSFEPVVANYELMKKTVQFNNIKNAVCENYALGNNKDIIEINVNSSASSVSDLIVNETKYVSKCDVIKLDDYVFENNLDVGLIKVDLEGYEQKFLAGAMRTIKEQKPVLLLSIYHNPDDFFNIKPLIESWNLGYTFKVFKPVDYSISLETLLIAEVVKN